MFSHWGVRSNFSFFYLTKPHQKAFKCLNTSRRNQQQRDRPGFTSCLSQDFSSLTGPQDIKYQPQLLMLPLKRFIFGHTIKYRKYCMNATPSKNGCLPWKLSCWSYTRSFKMSKQFNHFIIFSLELAGLLWFKYFKLKLSYWSVIGCSTMFSK